LEKELGRTVDLEEVKQRWKEQFEKVFEAELEQEDGGGLRGLEAAG
jgi:hypothetical protein